MTRRKRENFRVEYKPKGDIAHTHMNALSRDDMNREQFINGWFDSDIYELVFREGTQMFDEAVNRALSSEAIMKRSGFRQRKRISAKRNMAEAIRNMEGGRVTVQSVKDVSQVTRAFNYKYIGNR